MAWVLAIISTALAGILYIVGLAVQRQRDDYKRWFHEAMDKRDEYKERLSKYEKVD